LKLLVDVELYWVVRGINNVVEVGCKVLEFVVPTLS
jgi:hypothetical protein